MEIMKTRLGLVDAGARVESDCLPSYDRRERCRVFVDYTVRARC